MINMARKWDRSDAVVAQRISTGQIGGLLSKNIHLLDKEVALLEEDGKTVKKFEHGKHKVGGLFSGSVRDIVFVDTAEHLIRREVKDLWTKEDKEITAAVEMNFMVSDPERLRSSMMPKKDIVTLEDIWSLLQGEIVSSVMMPVVKKKKIDQLQGETSTAKEIGVSAEVGLRKRLESAGLQLISFSVQFMLPGEYRNYLRKRGVIKEEAENAGRELELETRKAIHERDVGEIRGTVIDREQVLDELEKEKIKREGEIDIEEEETQQDMQDALEALKLKEIKDKQKILRDSERKKLGLEALKDFEATGNKGLEKRYDELQRMIEATEKKYLKRKIDPETFKRLMEEYQKKKTEIEVRMGMSEKEGK